MGALKLLEPTSWHSISCFKFLSQFSHLCHRSYLFVHTSHYPSQSKFFSRDLVSIGIMISEGKELISVTSGIV